MDATIPAMHSPPESPEDHADALASDATPLIEARALTKEYARGTERTCVVDAVSFRIMREETLGLVGESGSGKSTVARMLLHLIEPSAGQVFVEGQPLPAASSAAMRQLRRRMQIVFQDPYAALNPRMTVRQILAEPFAIHHDLLRGDPLREGLPKRLQELLSSVGMDESALPRYAHEFSGGQRQRINIARALAMRPEFLVLDEPVSALDVSVGAQVINLLRDLQRTLGLTYLFISHSMPLVRYLCDRVAVMQRGKLVEIGECIQVCETPRNPYTRQLIAATPEMPARVVP